MYSARYLAICRDSAFIQKRITIILGALVAVPEVYASFLPGSRIYTVWERATNESSGLLGLDNDPIFKVVDIDTSIMTASNW